MISPNRGGVAGQAMRALLNPQSSIQVLGQEEDDLNQQYINRDGDDVIMDAGNDADDDAPVIDEERSSARPSSVVTSVCGEAADMSSVAN